MFHFGIHQEYIRTSRVHKSSYALLYTCIPTFVLIKVCSPTFQSAKSGTHNRRRLTSPAHPQQDSLSKSLDTRKTNEATEERKEEMLEWYDRLVSVDAIPTGRSTCYNTNQAEGLESNQRGWVSTGWLQHFHYHDYSETPPQARVSKNVLLKNTYSRSHSLESLRTCQISACHSSGERWPFFRWIRSEKKKRSECN